MPKAVTFMIIGLTIICAGLSQINIEYTGEAFTVERPLLVHVEKRIMVDFDVYHFSHLGNGLLGAYVGNFPNTSLFDENKANLEYGVHHNLPYMMYTHEEPSGEISKQILFTVPNAMWPSSYHFWYNKLTPEMAKIADAIIFSLKNPSEQNL